jgi:hypothetical protein
LSRLVGGVNLLDGGLENVECGCGGAHGNLLCLV